MKTYPEDTPLETYFSDQLSVWPLARDNFRALKGVRVRPLTVGGVDVLLQYNPARIVSSSARIDKASLSARKCFLCRSGRDGNQACVPFRGRKGKDYDILVNPYPIFTRHFTIPSDRHVPQSIWHRYVDMLALAGKYPDYTIFYNGPRCGASAPDHMHFQAGLRGVMPMEKAAVQAVRGMKPFSSHRSAEIFNPHILTRGVFVIRSSSSKDAAKLFYRLLDCCPQPEGEPEPMINLLTFMEDGCWWSIVFVRKAHRSRHYYAEGDGNIFMSLGSVDMGGLFIAALEKDFDKVTASDLEDILSEISIDSDDEDLIIRRMSRTQPTVEVGIAAAPEITFRLLYDGAGTKKAVLQDGKILYDGMLYDELFFEAPTPSTMFAPAAFELDGVVIGKDFHWQQQEVQRFAGALKLLVSPRGIEAVNVIGAEDYLLSVISSEMKSTSPKEFLKAHAVISRSWLYAQTARRRQGLLRSAGSRGHESPDSIVRWYDGGDHDCFDVCADDHCQRYQGTLRAAGRTVREVIDETWGQVLTYSGEICDTRFSKCCGGRTELFSTCWEDRDYPYLASVEDPYCNTSDAQVLSSVLNSYDLQTRSFYRWSVRYGVGELSELVRTRSGIDFGTVRSLEPLGRGPSGRIYSLRIVGDRRSMTIGKELEIRRILSPSHLYSSAFDVVAEKGPDGQVKAFVLEGRGWGHGVGLCQIGAAVMGSKGFSYRKILEHYYPGSCISGLQDNNNGQKR